MNSFLKPVGIVLVCSLLTACSSSGGGGPSTNNGDKGTSVGLDDSITAKTVEGSMASLGSHTYDGGITGGAVAAADVPDTEEGVVNINGEVKTVELGGVTYYRTNSFVNNDTGEAGVKYTNTAENKEVQVVYQDLDYGGFLSTYAADATQLYITGDSKNSELSIFGNYTEPDSMPTTTATYAATMDGEVSVGGVLETVVNDGQGTLTADFSANSLSGAFSNFSVFNKDSSEIVIRDDITVGIDTTISGNTFAGTSTYTEGDFEADMSTNTVEGAFLGPDAAELVGKLEQVFNSIDNEEVHIVGAFTGKKQ